MRSIGLLAALLLASAASAQQAVQLPHPPATPSQPADTFRFVSDGPAGPGWGHHDEIARKYFHEDLPALFERTIMLDAGVPDRATLRWIFTGPRAGLTVELTSSKVRISERYYDSTALYEGQGNYPEKTVFTSERQFTGDARALTVIADAHLAVRVLVNGLEILEAPMLFDVTRHQLMLAASRTAHDVVNGSLLKPELEATRPSRLSPPTFTRRCSASAAAPAFPPMASSATPASASTGKSSSDTTSCSSANTPWAPELKPDMSNLDNLADSTPHYYGDNFPNSELSSFDYSRHILALGGSVIYELWVLPSWANMPGKKVRRPRPVRAHRRHLLPKGASRHRCRAGHRRPRRTKSISRPKSSPPWPSPCVARSTKLGFTQTKIHMADASYMFLGIDRANALRANSAAWNAIDFSATHEYDFQEFISNPDLYDARMRAMHDAAAGKPFLATEICINDPHYQEPSYRIAFAVAQLYYKNLTELDAIALMYCWTLLDVEQHTFAGSRSLLAPDRTRGWIPVPTSFQLRVLGAFSRHVLKGTQRIGVSTGDPDLLATAFVGANNETLVVINRSTTARKLAVDGAAHPWTEIERTGLEEENSVSAVTPEITVEPGEIVVLSTIKAE